MENKYDRDFAIAAYNDSRSEIRDRIGYRDKWILSFVSGVVTFLGAAIAIKDMPPDDKIILCLVMPVLSIIVARNVSAHVLSIEDSGNFIREKINPLFDGVPNWDEHIGKLRNNQTTDKDRRRRMTDVISIHLPSIISLFAASMFIKEAYVWKYGAGLPLLIWAFILAIFISLIAIRETMDSYEERLSKANHSQKEAD